MAGRRRRGGARLVRRRLGAPPPRERPRLRPARRARDPLERAIREARETVCLLTYVYRRGEIAHEVADALCDRASAGVECNVIIDAVGGMKLEREVVERMIEAGVRVSRFRPPKPYAAKRVANRTHRKILVADGRVRLTGGVGIAEEWTGSRRPARCWQATATCPSSTRRIPAGR